jgi:hypothetical protein
VAAQIYWLCRAAAGPWFGMTDDEMYLAIGLCLFFFLLTMFVMDQCKRRRTGEEAQSHARRVQQDRTARPDGSKITSSG